MSASLFLDTNIVAYSFDKTAPEKAAFARSVLRDQDWQISWQIVQEFANVALFRFKEPLTARDLSDYLKIVLWPKCSVYPSEKIFQAALEIHLKTQYRFYDSLVVASAVASGATILYSEDLQHGRKIGGIEIRNPFL